MFARPRVTIRPNDGVIIFSFAWANEPFVYSATKVSDGYSGHAVWLRGGSKFWEKIIGTYLCVYLHVYAVDGGRPITFRGSREVSAFVLNILTVVCAGGADKKTLQTQVPRGIVYVYYHGVSTLPPTLPGARPLCISSPAGVSEVILLLCYNMRNG